MNGGWIGDNDILVKKNVAVNLFLKKSKKCSCGSQGKNRKKINPISQLSDDLHLLPNL